MTIEETPGGRMDRDPLEGRKLRCLVGPTAAGKTALALAICERTGAHVVSLDSMQVYRGMDIGTAKASEEERARVRHYMIDLIDPDQAYDVHQFLTDLRVQLLGLEDPDQKLLFVGGTAFYLKVLLSGLFDGPPTDHELRKQLNDRLREDGNERLHAELSRLDPISAARIHPNDSKRLVRALEVHAQSGKPLSEWQKQWGWSEGEQQEKEKVEIKHHLVGLSIPPEDLSERIGERVKQMIDAGWIEEACGIRDGVGFGATSIQALGYAQILDLAEERITRAQCEELVTIKTRQFARRQRTWYRKFDIEWLYTTGRGISEHHVTDAIRALGWK